MAENVENLILEHLRAIRATQSEHTKTFEEMGGRLLQLERSVLALRRDQASDADYTLGVQEQVDRLRRDVDRIKTRLEIVDPAAEH